MKNLVLFIFIFGIHINLFSQDLNDILEKESPKSTTEVFGVFNGTRILNSHSIETRKKGILEFLIHHRFGTINSGFDQLFGLDDSNIRLGFEYAFTNDFTVALGRSSFEKTFDGYLKYRLLKQKTGERPFPFSLTLFGSAAEKTIKDYDPDFKPSFSDRLTYTSQLLIAKKFNQNFSFQILPTYIHYNKSPFTEDPNNIYALGFGTRVKISKRVSLNGEYYNSFNSFESIDTKNMIALGIDIETGGHIFQLIFTNSRAMIEKGFIVETTGDFFKGDIHFGFNISRAFQINKPKEPEKLY
jgi:hypothetical protein